MQRSAPEALRLIFSIVGKNHEWNRASRSQGRGKRDGTFAVDGRTIDLKKKMVKWKEIL